MPDVVRYVAATVPRSLRLMRPGLFPSGSIIGSLVTKTGVGSTNSMRDIVMMSPAVFRNMKANANVHITLSPALRMGADFYPGYVFTDIHEVLVPPAVPDPYSFARDYFLQKFGAEVPQDLLVNSASGQGDSITDIAVDVRSFLRYARSLCTKMMRLK